MPPILISLTSFGAAETRRHGQLWFTYLAHAAGVQGVEVREELLVDADTEIPLIATAVRDAGMAAVYSCPAPLWLPDGTLNQPALVQALTYAAQLGANRLKFAIGHYGPGAHPDSLPALQRTLAPTSIELVIENDQTVSAGTVPALQAFFAAADAHGLPLGMTFDMGNWHWNGECPLQAAQAFASRVVYVHCKGVQRLPAKWVAVPLSESAAPWRAVLRALPSDVPWAIEYPLIGDDLLAVTTHESKHLRAVASAQANATTHNP